MLARSVYRSSPVRAAVLCSARTPGLLLRPGFSTLGCAARDIRGISHSASAAAAAAASSCQPRPACRRLPCLLPQWRSQRKVSTTSPSAPPSPLHDPLHILFCGTDDFSCVALQALYDEMVAAPATPATPASIASIQVLVRPAKRTGRGLKAVVASPVQRLAQQLGLRVHERDTFTGWQPPLPVNMVVAVSFGLFVPPRILRACAYGGLNVHPSLLPDLHGAAPIEHAILRGRARTGVTVQTLHETTFDGGRRLLAAGADTDIESDDIFRIDDTTTAQALRQRLAPVGARLLVEVLRQGLFLPGGVETTNETEKKERTGTPAPKLSKADQEIQWSTTAAQIDRQARALGPVWTHIVGQQKKKQVTRRVILEDVGLAAWPGVDKNVGKDAADEETDAVTFQAAGRGIVLPVFVDGTDILLPVGVEKTAGTDPNRAALRVRQAKVEGYSTTTAAQALGRYVTKTAASRISWDVVTGTTGQK